MSEYFVHESSYVDENVKIGQGTKIWHFSHIQSGAVIGNNCSFGPVSYTHLDVYKRQAANCRENQDVLQQLQMQHMRLAQCVMENIAEKLLILQAFLFMP